MGGWLFSAVSRTYTHGHCCEARIVLAPRSNINPLHGGHWIRQSYAKKAHVIITPLWTFWRSTTVIIQNVTARVAAVSLLFIFAHGYLYKTWQNRMQRQMTTKFLVNTLTKIKRTLSKALYITESVVMTPRVVVFRINSLRSLHLIAIFAVLHTGLVIWVFDIT